MKINFMKSATLLLLISLSGLTAISQTPSAGQDLEIDKFRHHELGVDVTGFIKYFTNIVNSEESVLPFSVYQFSYRFKMQRFGNVRFGAGGAYNEREFQNVFIQDSTIRKFMNNIVNVRIGWEYQSEISKRWQAFYGIDFRPGYGYLRNDAVQYNGGYVVGEETKIKVFGVAPLLGFRFKITPRLSLTSEASFSLSFQESTKRTYFVPLFDTVPPQEEVSTTLKSTFGNFNAPLSIIMTFDL